MSQEAHQFNAYLGFQLHEVTGSISINPRWDASPLQGYHIIEFIDTNLYPLVARGTVIVKCLACDTRHCLWAGAHFLKVPKCFRTWKSDSKISNLLISSTELFYSDILNMNCNSSSLHTRSFRHTVYSPLYF